MTTDPPLEIAKLWLAIERLSAAIQTIIKRLDEVEKRVSDQ